MFLGMSTGEAIIERVTAEHGRAALTAALELVLRGLPDEVRRPFAAGLITAAEVDDDILAELWRCLDPRDGMTCGAVWAQIRPGGAAVVWPPQWSKLLPPGTTDPLLRAVLRSLTDRGATLAQSLLVDRHVPEATTLAGCGFTHAADLQYLSAEVAVSDARLASVDSSFSFEPIRAGDESRLAAIVEETYVGTRDCPALDGLRSAQEVLDEYRTIGAGRDELWRIVKRNDRNVGCLLLADHPSQSQVELVYMGVVPTARGGGGGAAMVREALRIAATLQRARVVLAVDAANDPAVAIYQRCGFTTIETRTVMICRLMQTRGDDR